jgi:glycosyltransferase involved in cell wall biosynthesis
MNSLSVIICTLNPRQDYLERTLEALRTQSLGHDHWELVIVDNASDSPLASRLDLSWHPQAVILREETPGIGAARICGFGSATADLIVCVDDDNVLAPDYLEQALKIGESHPFLGAWGGANVGEFDEPPDEWLLPCLEYLAIRPAPKDMWSNLYGSWESTPIGAGMCLRRAVVDAYLESVASTPKRLLLGRSGSSMVSSEDIDIVFHAIDIGLGVGRFPSLRLTHLIPKQRCARDYLLKLVEGTAESQVYLDWFRSQGALKRIARLRPDQVLRLRLSDRIRGGIRGEILLAQQRGRERGYRAVEAGWLKDVD